VTDDQKTQLLTTITAAEATRTRKLEAIQKIGEALQTFSTKDRFIGDSATKILETSRAAVNAEAVAAVTAAVSGLVK
jgi:hypothetical protein